MSNEKQDKGSSISFCAENVRFDIILGPSKLGASHMHLHSFFEVFYSPNDTMHMHIDETIIEINKGEMIIVAPSVYHSVETKGGSQCYNFLFSFQPRVGKSGELYKTISYILCFDKYIVIQNFDSITILFDLLFNAFDRSDDLSRQQTRSLAASIVFMLLQRIESQILNSEITAAAHGKIETRYYLDNFFASEYQNDISLEYLADRMNLSPKSVSRIIKEIYATSFSNIKNKHRIENAKALLLKQELSVKDIAYKVGYSSERRFFAVFLQLEGCTPTEYRNKTIKQVEGE